MCGIAGIYNYESGHAVDESALRAMLATIRHRGPDGEGVHMEPPLLGIGARRLGIIDIPGGDQPITNEDGSIVVVFNGEIYNYKALTCYLKARGHQFKTKCDTETIVHLYEEFAEDCVQRLRGMFAFALWDARRRRLLLARDRIGIKPLYYADQGALIFGSEIKSLFQCRWLQPTPDLRAMSAFLSLKYVPSPSTMFIGVRSLSPGHFLTCDRHGVKVKRYWDLAISDTNAKKIREDDYAAQLNDLLRESVRAQLVSDAPFGAFLSGGVDSSTVVALMSKELSQPVKTYSIGYEGAGQHCSELKFARMVAEHCVTDHHEVVVSGDDFVKFAEKITWHLDQPVAEEAAIPNYLLASTAAKDVKMVLTGEGGDELFAGYGRYTAEQLSSIFGLLPRVVKSALVSASTALPRFERPKRALRGWAETNEIRRILQWFPLFTPEMKADLVSEDLAKLNSTSLVEGVFSEHAVCAGACEGFSKMLYLDTKLYLPDALLARGDKASMAASIEARVPLLDERVVEFAASLPRPLKLKGFTRKYLLKKVAARLLPEAIIHRKKEGFPMPIAEWFRNEARAFLFDTLSPTKLRDRGLFNPAYVQQLLTQHDRRSANNAPYFWPLINVELWYRAFIDEQPVAYRTAA